VRLRAEIRAGEILKAMKQNGERRAGKTGKLESGTTILKPTLADLGILPDQSSQWQQLAEIPEREMWGLLWGLFRWNAL